MTKSNPVTNAPDPNAQRRFRVTAPLGMTLTDATGNERDVKAGAVVTWADLHIAARYLPALLRVGDLEEIPDAVPDR